MFVYNPLNRESQLFALYQSVHHGDVQQEADAELLRRYRGHARGLYRSRGLGTVPEVIGGDDRKIVGAFRAFLPALLERADLPPSVTEGISVAFPMVSVSDARADTVGGRPVVYVTSGTLDAIELFANTVSLCAGLNLLAIPTLGAMSDSSVEGLPLAWLSLRSDTLRGMSVSELLTRVKAGSPVPSVMLFFADSVEPQLRSGFYSYLLSYYLMQLLMRQLRRTATGGWDGGPRLHNPPAPRLIDRDYLAVLTLSFIVLHEIGHHPLRHNEIGFQGWPHEIAFSEALTRAVIEVAGPDAVLGTPGGVGPFELKADSFPLEITPEALREPLLEAASLWIAAHERAQVVAGNRFDDLRRMHQDKDAHPSPALRVWTLNGRFSTGIRQGDIARTIADYAEGAAAESASRFDDPELEAAVYQSIWDHAAALADPGKSQFPRGIRRGLRRLRRGR